jgi:hypothetical protein
VYRRFNVVVVSAVVAVVVSIAVFAVVVSTAVVAVAVSVSLSPSWLLQPCENTAFLFQFLLLFLQLLSDFFCFFNLTFFVTTEK